MDHYDFGEAAATICRFIVDYQKFVGTQPITPDEESNTLFHVLTRNVTDEGESFDEVFEDFKNKVVPRLVHWNHPMNFSSFPSPNSFASVLGDMLCVSIGGVGFSWKSCPALTELESLMADWYARLIGLPSSFIFDESSGKGGGCFQQTSTDGIYTIIIAARSKTISMLTKQDNTLKVEDLMPKLVVYASKDCHFCVKRLCGIECISFRAVKTDAKGSMNVDELEKLVQTDKRNNLIPILVIATLGTYAKFGVDDIGKIYAVTNQIRTIWLHADASFGGSAMALRKYSNFKNGLGWADSILACPHKWLQVALDSPTLWTKNTKEFQKVFVINPVYLQNEKPDVIDYRHSGIALSRRFRAFKMWLTFNIYGTERLLIRVAKAVSFAEYFANKLSKTLFKILNTQFTFVNFVLNNRNDQDNRKFYNVVKRSRLLLLSAIEIDGKFALRFSPVYQYTREDHIDNAIDTLQKLAHTV